MIEAWGRGFGKIKDACAKYEKLLLEYDVNKFGIMMFCKACDRFLELLQDDNHHDDFEFLQGTKICAGNNGKVWTRQSNKLQKKIYKSIVGEQKNKNDIVE